MLNEAALTRLGRTDWAGCEIHYYESVDSTNTRAKELAEAGHRHGTLVVADRQTAGKGRRGRTWESPSGCGVFMTLVLRPDIAPDNTSMLTLVAALAAARALNAVTGEAAQIKWPNDIVLHAKKVCGILTELSVSEGRVRYLLLGMGINVHNESFPGEIAHVAGSLFTECGRHYRRAEVIEETLVYLEQYYRIFLETEDLKYLQDEYHSLLVNRGEYVRVLDPAAPFEGVARGITDRGELIVDDRGIRRLVSSGEVSVRGIYGYV